ncbi:cytochrome c biogenesis protein CcdA [Nocardioides sp. zg-536]|uniref:Cytochrome c biogenesis protein CcdA n=1 Tax=Nocardioides faecalis TaxID=2803858 RepID=A0A939BZJ2_9ACTN|nr:cytochrome c biogenesis CcdA family protein [Nocardioides faecalis]MBM9461095.1 cytochrome c biogenesis protein CcdA [Nocardioides faecalis]MBS4752000.1 cytochrome c biogenesis protein CcdA [Nocardioides faecalis]QVI59175.1 cytochrome c biogenesis protein CcdA [Nocardioides faecalis]
MQDWFTEQAAVGSLGLAVPVALVAGLVSFFSPCVLPLLPGYLSYATGLSGADLAAGEAGRRRGRMLLGSGLFVLGFAVVFVIYGTAFGSAGTWLRRWDDELQLLLGLVLIVLGLVFAGVLSWFQRDLRIHKVPAVGLGAAPLIGALFAIGWTPCVGPTFGVILNLTFADGATAARGGLLALCYALGLGLPFVAVAVGYNRLSRTLGWVRRHQVLFMRVGGAFLVLIGLLMVTGWWDHVVQWAQLRTVEFGETAL